MWSFFSTTLQIIISIYWAGEVVRQNPKVENLIEVIERGYKSFNSSLKDVQVVNALRVLRKIYVYLIVIIISAILIQDFLSTNLTILNLILSRLLPITLLGWFSLEWCLDHKKYISGVSPQVLLIIVSPVLFVIIDQLMSTSISDVIVVPCTQILDAIGYEPPTNNILISMVCTLTITLSIAIFYILAWFISVPIAFVSAILVCIPIFFARLMHYFFPHKPFFGFTVLAFIIVSFYK